jgi:histidinol-phosphate aminotransferase
MKIEELVRPNILTLKPYSSARDEYSGSNMVNLDANENPYGDGLNRYPDPYQRELKQRIAEWKRLKAENLILGNGSDEVIDLIMRAFGEPGKDGVLTFDPTYGMYKVSADINNLDYHSVPLNSDFSLDVEAMLKAVQPNTKMIFICSPNNPSGNLIDKDSIERILTSFNGIVVIDEAYIDFATENSWTEDLNNYPQLIVLQTFSKCIGMAGIRLGMGWASKQIIEILNKIKPPYNVNELTQQRALSVLKKTSIIEEEKNLILDQKDELIRNLEGIENVVQIYPSSANFILIKVSDADKIYSYLINEGIVVRNRSKVNGCENCLRITIGAKEENQLLISKLKAYKP